MLSSPSKSDDTFVALLLVSTGLAALCNAGGWYLCGLWARSSLKAPFLLSPAAAITRITPNWISGAILLAAGGLVCEALFGGRTSAPLRESGISFAGSGYLIGSFGGAILAGYLTALVSKWGLRKAISADHRRKAEPDSPPVSFCLPARAAG